jgi:hypothetical protein
VRSATVPDASGSDKGIIQLDGDLAGSADHPLVAQSAITTDKIADAGVTYAKIQNVTSGRLLGNPTNTTGPGQEIAIGKGLNFSGDSLYSTAAASDTFTANITVTSLNGLGKYTTGSVINAVGKTASQVLADALTQKIPPVYQAPTADISSTPASGTFEIGVALNIILSGTYTQNNGGTATGTVYSGGVALSGNTDHISSLTVPISYTATISYSQGACLNDNQGNQDCSGQITEGSVTSSAITFTPMAKRYWGRCSVLPNSATIITAAGGGSELSSSRGKGAFTISASGSNNIYYAYPASLGALTSISVGGFDSFQAFTQYTASFTNASNYTQNYFVYVSQNTFSGDATNIIIQ